MSCRFLELILPPLPFFPSIYSSYSSFSTFLSSSSSLFGGVYLRLFMHDSRLSVHLTVWYQSSGQGKKTAPTLLFFIIHEPILWSQWQFICLCIHIQKIHEVWMEYLYLIEIYEVKRSDRSTCGKTNCTKKSVLTSTYSLVIQSIKCVSSILHHQSYY